MILIQSGIDKYPFVIVIYHYVTQSEEIKGGISLYCKGLKRLSKSMKQDLALKLQKGKKAMLFEVYSYLAKGTSCSQKKEHIFAHFFSFRLVSNRTMFLYVLINITMQTELTLLKSTLLSSIAKELDETSRELCFV